MIRYLKSYPLFREKIADLTEFDVNHVSELLDKTKKVLKKLQQVNKFDSYHAALKMNIQKDDIKLLIEALSAQYDFL